MPDTANCLDNLKSTAAARLEARLAAAPAANALQSYEDRIAAYAAMPKAVAECGAVSIRAIVPENRTAWRRAHVRFQYRLNGKVVTEAAARAALATKGA